MNKFPIIKDTDFFVETAFYKWLVKRNIFDTSFIEIINEYIPNEANSFSFDVFNNNNNNKVDVNNQS